MTTLCRLISLVSHLTPVVSSFLSRTSPLSGYFSFTAPFLLLISLSPPCFIGSFFILTLQFLLRSGYLVPSHLSLYPLLIVLINTSNHLLLHSRHLLLHSHHSRHSRHSRHSHHLLLRAISLSPPCFIGLPFIATIRLLLPPGYLS